MEPTKMTLIDFNTKINDNLSLVLESDPNCALECVLHTWIRALPSDFSDLQMILNKSNLNDKWTNASTAAQLFILTIKEMRNCNIEYNTKSTKQPSELKPLTIKLVKRHQHLIEVDSQQIFQLSTNSWRR